MDVCPSTYLCLCVFLKTIMLWSIGILLSQITFGSFANNSQNPTGLRSLRPLPPPQPLINTQRASCVRLYNVSEHMHFFLQYWPSYIPSPSPPPTSTGLMAFFLLLGLCYPPPSVLPNHHFFERTV